MKNYKNIFLIALCAFVLMGCKEDKRGIVPTTQQSNPEVDYEVTFLFEVDGIRVYRFYDYDCRVYFTNANGHTGYVYNQRAGKAVTSKEVQSVNSSTNDPDCPCQEKGGDNAAD